MADTTTKILEVIVDNNQALAAIADYNKLIDEQKQKQKELADDFKAGRVSQEDYYRAMAKSKEETKAYSRQIQELSKEVQNNIKQEQEHDGSLRGLRAALSNATKEYDALSRAERQGAKGKELQEHINKITDELKEAEEETQRFYRNVGNYPDVQPLETQLGEIKKQLAQMKYEGKENTEEFRNMMGIASNMKDALADVEASINTGASDTAQLDALIGGTGTLLSLYAQYSVVSEKLGVQNEDLDKTFQVLTMTMGSLTALQSVMNMLQSQSALMKGVEAAQTWLQVQAEKAHAKAITATGVAQKIATAAQWAFNAAASANPIGLIVAAIVAAVAAIYGLVKAFNAFSGPSKSQIQTFKDMGQELDKLNEKYDDHIERLKATGATTEEVMLEEATLLNDMLRKRTEHYEMAKKLYDEDEDEFKDALEAKKTAEENYNSSLSGMRNHLESLWAASREKTMIEAYGETEYKLKQAKKAYDGQIKMIQQLRRANQISAMEMAKMYAQAEAWLQNEIDAIQKNASSSGSDWRSKQRDAIRAAFDKELELIVDKNERERKAEEENHRRTIEDLNERLKRESGLTKAAKAAIRKQIELEEKLHLQRMAKLEDEQTKEQQKKDKEAAEAAMAEAERTIALKLEGVKAETEEEYNLRREALAKKHERELLDTKLTEEQKLLMKQNYQKALEQMEDEYLDAMYQKHMDVIAQEWDNRIAEATLKGENVLALEVERRKAELDALHQMEEESDAEFKARMLAAEQAYTDSKKALLDQQRANTQANMQASAAVLGSLSQLLNAFGEENEAAAKAAKVLALGEIAINTGKAIAAGVAQAQSVPFPANIGAIATTVATVLANVATAISTVKSAKFATGGIVVGPGTGTSDSIPARLSNGESVMNARSTAMFGPILSSLNQAGGGVAFNPRSGGQNEGFQFLAAAVASGMNSVDLHVGVDEITRVNERVDRIKEVSNIG